LSLPQVFEPFVRQTPLPVMVRGVLEKAFAPEQIDIIYDYFSDAPTPRKLLFSMCLDLMLEVVTRTHKSLHAAIRHREHLLPVQKKAVYSRIAGISPEMLSAMVTISAADMSDVVRASGGELPPLVSGLRTRILDGNHLSATQHRLKALRNVRLATLPGTSLVLLDPALMLMTDVFLLEDAHASERSALPEVANRIFADDLIIGDRNFCLTSFVAEILARKAFFLFRQHGSNLPLELLGERTFVGETATGRVYEQAARTSIDGQWQTIRRITIELNKPTRDKAPEIHLVTNVPAEKLSATAGSDLYLERWTLETAFQNLTVELACEIDTLGYPKASLFAFTAAVMCYNAYSVVQAALRGAHGAEKVQQKLSTYYMADEISRVWHGMHVIVQPEDWTQAFAKLSPHELASVLVELARNVNLHRFRKAPTRPRKPVPKGAAQRSKSHHASTAKILAGTIPK
jgi:hypothetical protein